MEAFESSQVSGLVGAKPFYLNKFVERRLYRIKPSVRAKPKRGRPRLFSTDDVFAIGLVWWLFEAGLRTKAIEYVLNQICGRKGATAYEAARKLLDGKARILLIRREPRTAKTLTAKRPSQSVEVTNESDVALLLGRFPTSSFLLMPIGESFAALKQGMNDLQRAKEWGG